MAAVKEKAAREPNRCLYSGKPVAGRKARFLPGYDMKMKSLLLKVTKGEEKLASVPKPALAILKTEGLLGFRWSNGVIVAPKGSKKATKTTAKKAA